MTSSKGWPATTRWMDGGTGADTLSGGDGLDVYRFASALSSTNNHDLITDFMVADDSLQLESAIFTKLTTTGVLAAANFRANSVGTAADSNDYVVYETDTGHLF